MFKSTMIAAAAVAASVFAFQPGEAKAGSNVQFHIGVGVPYHGYSYGYAAPAPYYDQRTHYRHYAPAPRPYYRRMSCNDIRYMLRDRGFHHIAIADCRGRRYGFKASRHGKRYYISVSARTGRVLGKFRI